jgi:hypothetical protein
VEAGRGEAFNGWTTTVVEIASIAAGLRRQGRKGFTTFMLLGAFLDCVRFTFFFIDFIELTLGIVVTPPPTGHKFTRWRIGGIYLRGDPPKMGFYPA